MTGRIDARIAELGLTLPDAPAAAAIYTPFVRTGSLVYISGQVSMAPGGLIAGTLGADMEVAAGQDAARVCALNLIAQMKAACWPRSMPIMPALLPCAPPHQPGSDAAPERAGAEFPFAWP